MKWQFEDKATLGQFSMITRDTCLKGDGILNRKMETINTIVYNMGDEQEVIIDKIAYIMPSNSVLPLMANQHFVFELCCPVALLRSYQRCIASLSTVLYTAFYPL